MPTGQTSHSMTASAKEQILALPVRGTSALRKKALLEQQIQREEDEADRLERLEEMRTDKRLKEKRLRKFKAAREKAIDEYVNGAGGEDKKAREEKDAIRAEGKRAVDGKEIIMTKLDEKAKEEEASKMIQRESNEDEIMDMTEGIMHEGGTAKEEEAAYQKRKAEEVKED